MVYFFDQLSRRVIFFICAIPCFLSASLPMPSDEGLGLPIDASSGSMPSQPMPSPDLGTASMPNDLQTPMPMSLLPTPSLPIQSPTPDILTATQETSSQIAPITVTTTAPIIQKSPTSATLGSNINNVPTGMKTAPPAANLTNIPLAKTLTQLLNNTSSVLSVYDKETSALMRSGSVQQKITTTSRKHTDSSATSADFEQNACTAGALQVTARNKFDMPRAAHAVAKTSTMSFTKHKKNCSLKDSLFDNSQLEQKYKFMLEHIKKSPNFLPLFTKFHILALSQLYQYLIGIYVSLTMTHVDSLDSYIVLEQLYGLNGKALIIQYLVDLVERQLNQALLELFPTLPKAFLVQAGLSSLQCDHVSRLDLVFVDMEQVILATFGIKSILPNQWKTILTMLENPEYSNFKNLVGPTNLAPVVTKLHTYLDSLAHNSSTAQNNSKLPSFIQTLSSAEKSALVDFLDVATDQSAAIQEIEDCKHLAAILQNKHYDEFTEGQYALLKRILSYYSTAEPLQDAISTIESIQAKLNQQALLSTTITRHELEFMQSIIAFVLLSCQRNSIGSCHFLTQMFDTHIVPKKSSLSAKDWGTFNIYKKNDNYPLFEQKQLALSLSSYPNLLKYLNDNQTAILLAGIARYVKTNPSLSPNNLSIIKQLSNTIKIGGISANDLTTEQKALYKKILTYLLSYTPRNLSDAYFDTEFTKTFGPEYNDIISKKRNTLKQLAENITPREQVIFYCWIELLVEVMAWGIEKHAHEAERFGCLSLWADKMTSHFFKDFNVDTYRALLKVDKLLNEKFKTPKDLDSLTKDQKTIILTLLNMLVTSSDIKGAAQGVFTKAASKVVKDPQLDSLVQAIKIPETVNLNHLTDKISSPQFHLVLLRDNESHFLTDLLLKYEDIISQAPVKKTPSSQTPTQSLYKRDHPLSNVDDLTAQTVLSILHAEMHMTNNQDTIIAAFASLFDFFATYTASLHINPGDTASVINKEFSQFYGYARSLAHQLADTPAGKMNPPLFMYDETTLNHLAFLPTLAQTIQSTSHVFLPTQAINMALLEHPVPAKPIPGHDNNQVILQKDVPYNIPSLLIPDPDNPAAKFSPKFFFKDKNGKPFANGKNLTFPSFSGNSDTYQSITHPTITWLTKTRVPGSSSGSSDYKYYVTRPLVGQEGIYMNVPLLMTDQGDKNNVLARLYEQKIIAQPDWLNYPEGIMAMIRACLGDFVTALALDDTIFDPVLNYIIRYTLASIDAVPQDAGIPEKQTLVIADIHKSLDDYKERAQQELIHTYVNPAQSITITGAA